MAKVNVSGKGLTAFHMVNGTAVKATPLSDNPSEIEVPDGTSLLVKGKAEVNEGEQFLAKLHSMGIEVSAISDAGLAIKDKARFRALANK